MLQDRVSGATMDKKHDTVQSIMISSPAPLLSSLHLNSGRYCGSFCFASLKKYFHLKSLEGVSEGWQQL